MNLLASLFKKVRIANKNFFKWLLDFLAFINRLFKLLKWFHIWKYFTQLTPINPENKRYQALIGQKSSNNFGKLRSCIKSYLKSTMKTWFCSSKPLHSYTHSTLHINYVLLPLLVMQNRCLWAQNILECFRCVCCLGIFFDG